MSERSFLGIERTILWLGRRAVKDNHQAIPESYKTIVGSTLLEVCSQSPFVFQVSTLFNKDLHSLSGYVFILLYSEGTDSSMLPFSES